MAERIGGKSKLRRGLITFIAFTLFTACVLAVPRDGDKNATGNDAKSARPTLKTDRPIPPNLFVLTNTRLVDLRWDAAKNNYAHHATTTLHVKRKRPEVYRDYVSVGDNYVFVMKGEDLFRLDKKLRVAKSVKFDKLTAIAARGKHIFVSADGHFIALDEELKELSRVPLDCGDPLSIRPKPKLKSAYDILLHKDTAYLLDHYGTIFMFRIDVSRPERLKVTQRIGDSAIRTFSRLEFPLQTQCLDPQKDHWLVTTVQPAWRRASRDVQMWSMSHGKRLGHDGTWDRQRAPGGRVDVTVLGITRYAPIWAAVNYGPGRMTRLVEVHSLRKNTSSAPVSGLKLSASVARPKIPYLFVLIRRKGNHLFLGPQGGAMLEVVDVAKEPKVLLKTSLERFGIDKILDIRPH